MKDELDQKNTDNNEIEESAEELENKTSENDQISDDVIFDEEAELGTAEVIKKLREKLKVAVEEKQQYLNNWQKDKAEFINVRRRDEEAKQEFFKFAKQSMVEDILPVLDSFDMALAHSTAMLAGGDAVSKEWHKGMEGIYNQLVGILSKNDVKSFGAVGDAFDPNLHQSIGMTKTDNKADDHKVSEVLQKGYMLSGRVVRPAFVKVFEV